MKFKTIADLVDKVNNQLEDFCSIFQYKRKEIFNMKRVRYKSILFIYNDDSRDWAINPGGGTQLQFHIYLRKDKIGYGLGFNTQYVPHKNDMTTVEYMRPYANSFLSLTNVQNDLYESGFDFIIGDEEGLRNPVDDSYVLVGKELIPKKTVSNYELTSEQVDCLLNDLRYIMFDSYVEIINNLEYTFNTSFQIYVPKKIVSSKKNKKLSVNKVNFNVNKVNINSKPINYIEQHINQILIGNKVEEIVLKDEKEFLVNNGKIDLANQVCSVSNNPSIGFDIVSFELDGKQKQIEVKAISKNGKLKSFIITKHELDKSKLYANYYLCGVLNINSGNPDILRLRHPKYEDAECFEMEPIGYKVTFNLS